jgi:SAM-dependent methyltransferase
MSTSPRIFDRQALRLRRERLARRPGDAGFLLTEMIDRLLDRLADIKAGFETVLDVGAGAGALAAGLAAAGRSPATLVEMDLAAAHFGNGRSGVAGDVELLPFGADRFDAILSIMALHTVNDLPGALAQMRFALKPDGLLLAGLPGGETLHELRWALTQAELEIAGGAAPRVSPFVDVRDAGMLLQRAGLALPVADTDRLTVLYRDPLRLVSDLRAMGEASLLVEGRARPLRPAVLARALDLYRERFGGADGIVPATFDILFVTGWKPHASQPRPLRRGSGAVDLAKALGVPVEVMEGRGHRS